MTRSLLRALTVVTLFGSVWAAAPAAHAEESTINDHLILRYRELDAFWSGIFAQFGESYVSPNLVLVVGVGQADFAGTIASQVDFIVGPFETPCVTARPNGGSFYCAATGTIYLSYHDVMRQWSEHGDFAVSFLVAHEWGHHVEALRFGAEFPSLYAYSPANQTYFELQADCYAGLYAYYVWYYGGLEEGDLEEALTWVGRIGSDMFGNTDPTTWSHGSSQQRVNAFHTGYSMYSCEAYI